MAKMRVNESQANGAAPDMAYDRFSGGEWLRVSGPVPSEMALTVYINSQELVTVLCTPTKLNCLVLGFLYSEGIITGISDVAGLRVCEEESLADVKLNKSEYKLPTRRTLTSGCGAGTSFIVEAEAQKIDSEAVATAGDILSLMKQLQEKAELFRLCGGVHASALSDSRNLLVMAEDIGRHNTLDKIQGECLLRGISTRGRLLVATGRISSEMLLKAARMATPIVVSRSSPTERAISLAQDLGITLVGYARGSRLSVYSHRGRVLGAED